jgi:hypothetical protein
MFRDGGVVVVVVGGLFVIRCLAGRRVVASAEFAEGKGGGENGTTDREEGGQRKEMAVGS